MRCGSPVFKNPVEFCGVRFRNTDREAILIKTKKVDPVRIECHRRISPIGAKMTTMRGIFG
jgi:hypothetical protein